MPRAALYAGSFDPVTNGHLDVVRKAVRLTDRLVLAIGVHPGKAPLFSAEERLAMLQETCAGIAQESRLRIEGDDLFRSRGRRRQARRRRPS